MEINSWGKGFTSPVIDGPTYVRELIDETSARWREDLVWTTFLPMDASVILSLPLCTRSMRDFWSWSKEKKGSFTVRSAYRMLVQTKFSRGSWLEKTVGSSSHVSKDRASLWNTQVPSKIKVFLWRLAQHSLPTNDVLAARNMSNNPRCSLCGVDDSWKHSLLECSMSRCVWALADEGMVEHMVRTNEGHARNWLFALMASLSHVDFVNMMVTLWAIWFARRKAIHEA